MLRQRSSLRKYSELVSLLRSEQTVDEFGHRSQAEPVFVAKAYASVTRLSATTTMMTFERADVVRVRIEMRKPQEEFNIVEWRGHRIVFGTPEDIDGRGLVIRMDGYYQEDRLWTSSWRGLRTSSAASEG